jgi:L-ribulokinase
MEANQMAVVAGVDFGTLSVRVSIVDSARGPLSSSVAEYPLSRRKDDPNYATQRHADHMDALVKAMREAIEKSDVSANAIVALAVDTTGSTVVPVDEALNPIDDYYVWCDHRAREEAAQITEVARQRKLEALSWCGGVYSSEWGFAKVLHWLRNNPDKRDLMATAVEHCDMVVAVLCGISDPAKLPRSICAMGHKWLWNKQLGGLPSDEFWEEVDPLLSGIRDRFGGRYATSKSLAGGLSKRWAERLGLKPGIPIPVGAFDAHWDAVGAGIRQGDVVNVVGTSTCIMAIADKVDLIPGVSGVVQGSIHPDAYGIEAGLSACGDLFDAIAGRAGVQLSELNALIEGYRPGQTGLLRLTWDNGDRTVLVNPELGGMTLGWDLSHGPQDELFAAIEGTAFHTRIVLERMIECGVSVERVINGGGIPQKNDVLNQVYANVLQRPVLVPEQEVTSLGASIFAFLAAGVYATIEDGQTALCPGYRTIEPEPQAMLVYEPLFEAFRTLYFSLGQPDSEPVRVGKVLPVLRQIAQSYRE